jgi:EmrB/QacA subfamily drug resistance transporter
MRKETGLALAALGLANAMLAQDLAALNVALPGIERDLDIDLRTAQWVVNAYLLTYGMMIVTGGRLADEIGRRRVFFIGAALFATMSIAGGFASNATWLIAARALMGIGSGLMLPAITGMGYAVVPSQRAAMAGGLIVGAYAVGMAIGPIVGGGLTEYLGWRAIQFVNVPLAALAIFGVWRAVATPASPPDGTRIDYAGIITLSAGLVALLFGLDQAAAWGWGDWRILGSLGLSLALIVGFVLIERRAGAAALIPPDLMRSRGVSVACALKALFAPAYSASVLYLPQVMQKLMDFSPLESGIGMLPMLGGYAVVSLLFGVFAGRLGLRLSIIGGLAFLAIGAFLLSGFQVAAGYRGLVMGMGLMGVGLGLFQSSVVTAAVKTDDQGRKSLVSGVVLMFQFVGGAIGLGLTTTIVASAERSAVDAHPAGANADLPEAARRALDGLLAGTEPAQQVLQQFSPDLARELLDIAGEAFAAGVRAGLRLDAGLVLVAVVLAVLLLPRGAREAVPQRSPAPTGRG